MPVLRFATWNLLHGRSLVHGQVRSQDLAAGAKHLDADVVALQEVDRRQPRSGHVDLTEVVAEATGAVWWRFLPTVWGEPGVDWSGVHPDDDHGDQSRSAYGISLVSRLPMLSWDELRLPPAPLGMPLMVPGRGMTKVDDEPRGAIAATLAGPSGPFTVVGTHLSFVPGFNVRQLRHLVRWMDGKPRPHLLLGDLNLPGRLPRAISGWTQLARVPTYPSWKPRVQFDHVLADGIGEHQVQRVDSSRLPVSDHNALSVDLAL
jgi:endonuclease/exonuclease/phosphatase family metal-dependent hydrolase